MLSEGEFHEEWRKVVGWPDYSVSSLGRVRRDMYRTFGFGAFQPGGVLKPCLGGLNKTYLYIRLSHWGKSKLIRLHSLVAAAFIGPRPEGLHINHKDGDRLNNAAVNLEYVTRRQNEDHAVALGLHPWGEGHHAAKLTAEAVREIRASSARHVDLAAKFGVGASAIQHVRNGKTWRHLL